MDREMQDWIRGLGTARDGLSAARKERQQAQIQWVYQEMLERVAEEVEALKQIPLDELHSYDGARRIRLGLEELAEMMKAAGV